MEADIQLLRALKDFSIKTLLDVDAHFAKGLLLTKEPNDLTAIDCVCDETFWAIKENIYRHVYKNFSSCALKHYDAALIAETSPQGFDKTFHDLQGTTDLVITFARNGSELLKHIQNVAGTFAKVNVLPSLAGVWLFCYRHKQPVELFMYVVTHKALPPEHVQRLPAGYKVIHAGKGLGANLGYPGDDTGDNISIWNPYLNEQTALYWIWKNTSQPVVGLSHYRRFFTADGKIFLTREEALDLLKDYDIILTPPVCRHAPWYEDISIMSDLSRVAVSSLRKNLARTHPGYIEAFDYLLNVPCFYHKNMFVTRRNVFEAYCEWLFPFLIDTTQEVLNRTPLAITSGNTKRLMGFLAERFQTLWLLKNRLRIKEMNIIEMRGL